MNQPPDDFNIPDDALPPDDDNNNENLPEGDHTLPENLRNLPQGVKKRKVKIVMSPSSQEVKFADMFGMTLSPSHGIIKFGTFQPETGEFVVHTQIALTPQGLVGLAKSLQQNIEKVKKRKPGGGPGGSMN